MAREGRRRVTGASPVRPASGEQWHLVGAATDVVKRKKVVLTVGDRQILVLAHDGGFFAFDNICIHRERELSKGVVLNGKLVCPGHQWAFALGTGWEAVKEQCQPTHAVRVDGDDVFVFVTPSQRAVLVPTIAD